jgi:hypothetical protein
VGHRILGFLYEADLWYSTRALVYRRGASRWDRYHCTRCPWAQSGSPRRDLNRQSVWCSADSGRLAAAGLPLSGRCGLPPSGRCGVVECRFGVIGGGGRPAIILCGDI